MLDTKTILQKRKTKSKIVLVIYFVGTYFCDTLHLKSHLLEAVDTKKKYKRNPNNSWSVVQMIFSLSISKKQKHSGNNN